MCYNTYTHTHTNTLSHTRATYTHTCTHTDHAPQLSHHSGCVFHNKLYIFGGLFRKDARFVRTDQVWQYSFPHNIWTKLNTFGTIKPEARFGHTATATNSHINTFMYVFGGVSIATMKNLNDLWSLDMHTHTWRLVHATSVHQPSPRGYADMVRVGHNTLYLFGGARCDPGCECSNELWRFRIDTREWYNTHNKNSENKMPRERYKHSMVLAYTSQGAPSLIVFGGESYHPAVYHNDVWQYVLLADDGDEHMTIKYTHNHSIGAQTSTNPNHTYIRVFGCYFFFLIVVAVLICMLRRKWSGTHHTKIN